MFLRKLIVYTHPSEITVFAGQKFDLKHRLISNKI